MSTSGPTHTTKISATPPRQTTPDSGCCGLANVVKKRLSGYAPQTAMQEEQTPDTTV